MKVDFWSLVFVWLLPPPSCGGVTVWQTHNLTTASDQLTTPEAPTLAAETTSVHVRPSPQPFTTGMRTEAPTFSTRPQRSTPEVVGGSTVGPAEVSVGPGTLATAEAPTETGPTPPGTDATTSSIRNASSIPTSPPPGATAAGSATAPPTGPTNPADQTTTARGVFSKPPKKKAAPGKKAKSNSGAVVGWLIGSTLVLMMLSFLVIYFKKRKLNQQQISTKNWAGPSPFIESGQDDGPDGARSSHRVSLSSFLPQRMSRRLSLLQEAEEEMEDISPGTTFGDRHQEAEGRKGEDEAEETAVPAATPTSARPTEPLSPNGAVEPAQG